ncbi:MAG: hypothetical protein ABW109_21560, partial [Candidatus Thiodiazotropha sp. 6PLUC4]
MAIIQGTDRSDTLNGTDDNDQIVGNVGNDIIAGGTGNDLIYGDNGDNFNAVRNAVPLRLELSNVRAGSETSSGGLASGAGDSIIYDNVATLDDGTSVSARLILVSTSNSSLKVDLSYTEDHPLLLGPADGEQASFRMEFFDTATDEPVEINSTLVLGEIDLRDAGESAEFELDQITGYGTQSDSSVSVSENGASVVASGTQNNVIPDE